MKIRSYIARMALPSYVSAVCGILQAAGFVPWVVGGAVRDLSLGIEPHDFDLASDATPDQVMALPWGRVVPTGIAHGTVTVWAKDFIDADGVEITTFRNDGACDGRHAEVAFVKTIGEDLARRDFTMNALAMSPTGEIFDPFNGCVDLEKGQIRAVGNAADRFREDNLRVLRAIRFASKFGFDIEAGTFDALCRIGVGPKVSAERIRDELCKLLVTFKPSVGLRLMERAGLLSRVFGVEDMQALVGLRQNSFHAFDAWEHTLAVVDATAPKLALRLAALFHDVGKPSTTAPRNDGAGNTFFSHEIVGEALTRKIMTSLHFSNEVIGQVAHLVRHHFITFTSEWSEGALRRWLRTVGPANVANVLTIARADIAGKGPAKTLLDVELLDTLQRRVATLVAAKTESIKSVLSGHDVMKILNVKAGARVGKALRAMQELVEESPALNTVEALTTWVRDNG